jgi:RNA polymerase sigma-70 factor, ECF subfamily
MNTTDIIEISDKELVDSTLKGDISSFEKIVIKYEKSLLRYATRLLNNNAQDAEDVVSVTFFRAYKYLNSFDQKNKFSSWLYRIVHNQAVDLIKKKSGMFFVDLDNFIFVQKKTEENIKKQELEFVLDKLKQNDKNLLILYYLEEMTLNEIAEILNLTSNTVAKQLSRARTRAKQMILKLENKEE